MGRKKSSNASKDDKSKSCIQIYFDSIDGDSLEVRRKYAKFRNPNDDAIEELLPLVVAIAKDFVRRHPATELDDAVQYGNLGLINAVKHYDASRGFELTTYAGTCARNAMNEALCQNMTFDAPFSFLKNKNLVDKASKMFEDKNDRKPNINELSELTGLSDEMVLSTLLYQAVLDIDDESNDYADSIISHEKRFDKSLEDQELVNIGLAKLSPRAQDIVLLHFVDGYTLREIAARYNCTLQYISKVCKKSLKTMRDEIDYASSYGLDPMRA